MHVHACLTALRFIIDRSIHLSCSVKKGVLRNFTKFTRKHLCQNLIFDKVAVLRPVTLIFLRIGLQIFDPLYVLVSVARVRSRLFFMLQPIIDNATYVNNDIGYIVHVRDMVWFRSIITFNQKDAVIFVSQITTNGKIIQIHQTCTAG